MFEHIPSNAKPFGHTAFITIDRKLLLRLQLLVESEYLVIIYNYNIESNVI